MENKLTLEHLAPYLPYGLEGFSSNGMSTTIDELIGIYSDFSLTLKTYVNNHNSVDYGCGIDEFKPILRPLSDLTKEIEVDGEKFVPLEQLCKIAIDEYDAKENYFLSENIVEFEVVNNNSISAYFQENLKFRFSYSDERGLFSLFTPQELTCYFGLKYTNKLFEWHFDINNLIEKGLAIDINTLENGK